MSIERVKAYFKGYGMAERVLEFPMDGTAHSVIVLRKVKPTPAQYPRRYAKIKQQPL